jgi:hypothetical protein
MEKQEKTALTISEALELTVDQLEAISVPVKYAQEIARPISAAVEQLRACLNALNVPDVKIVEPEEGEEADGESNGISV